MCSCCNMVIGKYKGVNGKDSEAGVVCLCVWLGDLAKAKDKGLKLV